MSDCSPEPGRVIPHSVLRPGVSIGGADAVGTLGLFVVDAWDTLCILSAKHVVTPVGHAEDAPVHHPALEDDPAGRAVGSLWWSEARLDAALVRVAPEVACSPEVLETGELVPSFRPPRLGDLLEKSSRTTGTTRAVVIDERRPAAGLLNAFVLERIAGDHGPISCEGDSGAVWYDPVTGEGVGLHHGGEPDEGIAVAVSLPLITASWDFEPWNGTFIPEEEEEAA